MQRARILTVAVGAAGLLALVGCGEPAGVVSPAGNNWTVTFTKDFQNSIGEPLVTAVAVCRGESFWRRSKEVNVNAYGPTVALTVYCPTGIAAGSYESRHS